MLTIRNYERIKGIRFYEGSGWDTRTGVVEEMAYIQTVEEDAYGYSIRIVYIKPEPENGIVTIYREEETAGGYRVTIYKGKDMVHNEVWMRGDMTMEGILETIRRDTIYGTV